MSRDRGVYRSVHVRFWNDAKVRELSPNAKLLWFAIKTNPDGNMACLMRFRTEELSEITGMSNEDVTFARNELISKEMLAYDESSKLCWLIRALYYDPSFTADNPKILQHLTDLLHTLPESELIAKFITYYNLNISHDTLSYTPTVPSNSNRNSIQEQYKRFEDVWKLYPKKLGRIDALKHFQKTVVKEEDFASIQLALKNYIAYIAHDKIEEKFIKHGSTWFNTWKEWIPDA